MNKRSAAKHQTLFSLSKKNKLEVVGKLVGLCPVVHACTHAQMDGQSRNIRPLVWPHVLNGQRCKNKSNATQHPELLGLSREVAFVPRRPTHVTN